MAFVISFIQYLSITVCSTVVSTAGSTRTGTVFSHLKKCNANFTVVGMFPFHNDKDSINSSCTNIRETLNPYGIFESLAMVYTVIAIKKDAKLLPNIPLSVDISDSCNSVNAVTKNYLGLDFVRQFYEAGGEREGVERNEIAIIGSTTTAMGISLSTLSNIYNIPVVGYYATSPLLSNKDRFRSFFRTVPNDKLFVQALIELLERSDWNLITVLHTQTDYSSSAFGLLLRELKKRELKEDWYKDQVCVVSDHQIINTKDTTELDRLFDKIARRNDANIVVLLLHWEDSYSVLTHALKRNITSKLWIVSTDYLAAQTLYCQEKWKILSNRIITIQLRQGGVSKFNEFVHDHLINNTNTGLLDLLPISKEDIMYVVKNKANFLGQIPVTIPYVIDAVKAVAQALHHTLGCDESICRNSHLFNKSGLMENLSKVNFTSQLGEPMFFDTNGDTNGSYVIKGFSNNGKQCKLFDIAEWTSTGNSRGLRMLNTSKVEKFTSTCKGTCQNGYGKYTQTKNGCCWSCIKCSGNEYSSTPTGTCGQCSSREVPDDMNYKCIPLTIEKLDFTTSSFGIGVLSLSALGLVLVLLISIIFVIHKDTHMVRASNKLATSILLIGIALGYAAPLVLIKAQNAYQCGLYIYVHGLSVCLMTGALFTKVNRMYRIFRKQVMREGKLKFMTAKWQLATILLFVALGIILATIIVFNPKEPVRVKEVVEKETKSIKIVCEINFWIDFAPEMNAAKLPHGRLGTFGSMRTKRKKNFRSTAKSQETISTDIKPDDISSFSSKEDVF
eukprot:gene2987-1245_t